MGLFVCNSPILIQKRPEAAALPYDSKKERPPCLPKTNASK